MMLPKLTELAKGTAKFLRYQDGQLWYRIEWTRDMGSDGTKYFAYFDFPIGVDTPNLYLQVSDAIQALRSSALTYDSQLLDHIAQTLGDELDYHKRRGAGGGEFLAEDKAIRFMRWIRPYLEFLQKAAQTEFTVGE